MDKIREILNTAIKKRGSLYRVAKDVGVTYSAAHAWKTGKASPAGRNLIKLMELGGKTLLLCAALLSNAPVNDAQAKMPTTFNTSNHYTH